MMQAVALEIRIVQPDGHIFHAMGSDTMTYRDGRWNETTFINHCLDNALSITKRDRDAGCRAFLDGYDILGTKIETRFNNPIEL